MNRVPSSTLKTPKVEAKNCKMEPKWTLNTGLNPPQKQSPLLVPFKDAIWDSKISENGPRSDGKGPRIEAKGVRKSMPRFQIRPTAKKTEKRCRRRAMQPPEQGSRCSGSHIFTFSKASKKGSKMLPKWNRNCIHFVSKRYSKGVQKKKTKTAFRNVPKYDHPGPLKGTQNPIKESPNP